MSSATATVDDPAYTDVVNKIVSDLRASTSYVDPEGVLNYYELVDSSNPDDADLATQLVSEDRLSLLIPVTLVGTLDDPKDASSSS